MHKYFIAGALALALVFGPVAPAYAASLTEAQILAILNLLGTFGADAKVLTDVNASLRGLPTGNTGTVTPTPAPTNGCSSVSGITKTLYEGMSDSQVTLLQKFLAADPSVFPEASVTGYFGPATERAVERWQVKYSVVSGGTAETTGYGVVGSATRAAMMKLCGYATTPTTPPPTNPTTPTTPSNPAYTPAPSCTWHTNKSSVAPNETFTISWTSTNATYGTTKFGDKVDANGSSTVSSDVSGVYEYPVTLFGPGGSITCTAKVIVTGPVATSTDAPTCGLTASDNYNAEGKPIPTILTWVSANATQASAQSQNPYNTSIIVSLGSVATSGTMVVNPGATTNYIFTFTGPGGTKQCTLMLGYKG